MTPEQLKVLQLKAAAFDRIQQHALELSTVGEIYTGLYRILHQVGPPITLAKEAADRSTELVFIQNRGFQGNCLQWWKYDRCGYTCDLNQALRVPAREAESICESRPSEDRAWNFRELAPYVELHASCAHMPTGTILFPERKR